MNGRVNHDDTPEGRMAAVARSLAMDMEQKLERVPDYADYRDAFRPFMMREIIWAQISEARRASGEALTERVKELMNALEELKLPAL